MFKALIQSITNQGIQIVVNVLFTNTNDITVQNSINYYFGIFDTIDSISAKIQSDLDNMNAIGIQVNNLQSLIGTNLQTNQENLTAIQNNITAQNYVANFGTAITTNI